MALASVDIHYEVEPAEGLLSPAAATYSLDGPILSWEEERDDPMVASDDIPLSEKKRANKYAMASLIALGRQQHDDLYQVHPLSATVIFDDQPLYVARKTYDDVFRTAWNSIPRSKVGSSDEHALLDWFNAILVSTGSDFHRAKLEINLNQTVNEYTAMLEDMLTKKGFSAQDAYQDCLGGTVLDFLRSRDRITYVFTESDVQVLSYVADKMGSWLFQNLPRTKVEVAELTERF